MAHPDSPRSTSSADYDRRGAHAAFIVRVWRTADDAPWRVHLIDATSGRRLACDSVSAVSECIATRLGEDAQIRRSGLR